MVFPERFSNLPAYAWPRLRALLDPVQPGGEPINLTIGEGAIEGFVVEVALALHLDVSGEKPYGDFLHGVVGACLERVGQGDDEHRERNGAHADEAAPAVSP